MVGSPAELTYRTRGRRARERPRRCPRGPGGASPGSSAMAGTLIVEPDPGGHRFQAVANVARLAGRDGEVVLLTSRGATSRPEFENFLADRALEVDERFAVIHPPTAELLAAIAEHARSRDVARVVVMDA